MTLDTARTELAHFVRASLGKPGLSESDDIFVVGEASSLYSIELVMFIESELGIELDDQDLERDNFSSIAAMSGLLERKLNGA